MSKPQKNLYEHAVAGSLDVSAEAERLRVFEYPNSISKELLGSDLAGKFVLDIGAGDNKTLGTFVKENQGSYIAIDIREPGQERMGVRLTADLKKARIPNGMADIAHVRFMLAHFAEVDRKKVIPEIVGGASERAILIDYDWTAVAGNEFMEELKKLNFDAQELTGFTPDYGARLAREVESVVDSSKYEIATKRFNQGPVVAYQEVIGLIDGPMKASFSQKSGEDFARRLSEVRAGIAEQTESDHPTPFTRPDVIAVSILVRT